MNSQGRSTRARGAKGCPAPLRSTKLDAMRTRKLRSQNRRLVATAAGAIAILLLALTTTRAQDSAAPAPAAITGFAPSRVAGERQLEQKLRAIPDAAHAEANLRRLTSEPHLA